jgi:hypothetical protein
MHCGALHRNLAMMQRRPAANPVRNLLGRLDRHARIVRRQGAAIAGKRFGRWVPKKAALPRTMAACGGSSTPLPSGWPSVEQIDAAVQALDALNVPKKRLDELARQLEYAQKFRSKPDVIKALRQVIMSRKGAYERPNA